MGDEEQPSWLSNSSAPSNSSNSKEPALQSTSAVAANDPPYKNSVKGIFLIFNLGMMVFMAATGALGVLNADSVSDAGIIFVGIYMIVFAGIVFVYEISQICPCSILDNFMKRNFGFLYGIIGKGSFILFMGILAFGLSAPRKLAIACGVLTCAWGPLQIALYLKWPNYFDKKEKYVP
eukprot:gene8044-10899_t